MVLTKEIIVGRRSLVPCHVMYDKAGFPVRMARNVSKVRMFVTRYPIVEMAVMKDLSAPKSQTAPLKDVPIIV